MSVGVKNLAIFLGSLSIFISIFLLLVVSSDYLGGDKENTVQLTRIEDDITDIVPDMGPECNLLDWYKMAIASEELGTEVKISTSKYEFVKISGEVSKCNYYFMLYYYSFIPYELRRDFQKSGWHICITNDHLEDTLFQNMDISVCACTDITNKIIYIEDSLNGSKSIIHEFGHYLSWALGSIHKTEKWSMLFMIEGSKVSEYASTNTSECFAESFTKYICEPDELLTINPLIYTYIDCLFE